MGSVSSFGAIAMAAVLGLPAAAWAQPVNLKEGGAIFTCTNAAGRKLTADRPIAECNDREQRVLNKDGSLRMVLQPSLTADERAAKEEAEKRKAQERAAKADAVRRDRNLVSRYPDGLAHDKSREAALDTARSSIRASEQRLAELEKLRKPLETEAEFYQGKSLPPKLKREIESIDVSLAAQRELVMTQQAEIVRVNALYDAELARLRQLWAGAEPGSLGPLPQSAHATAQPPAAAPKPR